MAATNFPALTAIQTKAWVASAMKHERDSSFWYGDKGFLGTGLRDGTKPIHVVDQFTKVKGADRVVVPLVLPLEGGPRVGDQTLKGYEEELVPDSIEIRIDQIRKGTRNTGRFSDYKSLMDFTVTSKDWLADWHAQYKDELTFLTASGRSYSLELDGATRSPDDETPNLAFASDVTAPSSNRTVFAGSATATNNLTTADTMSWDTILKARAKAVTKRIKPLRWKGRDCWIIVMSPEQGRDLRKSSDYKTIVSQGHIRGEDNPLFRGAFAQVDGIYLFEHNKVCSTQGATTKYGSGANIDGAQALLVGAQAICYGQVKGSHDPDMAQQKDDYDAVKGIEYYQMYGLLKPTFKSPYDDRAEEDFSLLSIYTAASA